MEYYSVIKRKDILPFATHGWVWRAYAKWNKPDKDKYCIVSLICGILQKRKADFIETENRILISRIWGKREKWDNVSQRVQIFSYRKNKSKELIYSMVTIVNNMVLSTWKFLRIGLKRSHHKKLMLTMWDDMYVNCLDLDNHLYRERLFFIYIYIYIYIFARDTRDACSVPGSGRSPGGENGNPFQYSC